MSVLAGQMWHSRATLWLPEVATMVFGYPGRPELAYPNGSIAFTGVPIASSAYSASSTRMSIDEGLLRDQAVEGDAEVLADCELCLGQPLSGLRGVGTVVGAAET